ncbi:MAG: hypothetical protein WC829_20575 [Hyphomicrobium sp.]|jgi:hypothetical protein
MAQILSFRTPVLRSGDVQERAEGRSAEVIVFPGIRYDRWGEGDAASHSEERGVGRDVIELADR